MSVIMNWQLENSHDKWPRFPNDATWNQGMMSWHKKSSLEFGLMTEISSKSHKSLNYYGQKTFRVDAA